VNNRSFQKNKTIIIPNIFFPDGFNLAGKTKKWLLMCFYLLVVFYTPRIKN